MKLVNQFDNALVNLVLVIQGSDTADIFTNHHLSFSRGGSKTLTEGKGYKKSKQY
jgi:iron-sulfur cluster repair protein YtfE (RIC family)